MCDTTLWYRLDGPLEKIHLLLPSPYSQQARIHPGSKPNPAIPVLTNRCLLRLLSPVFTPTRLSARHTALYHRVSKASPNYCPQFCKGTYQIQRPPDKMVPHTGTVLTPAAAHQHDRVLLDVVPLSGDVGGDGPPRGEPDTGRLALARVGLLGPRDADLEADALALRGEDLREGRGDGVAGSLGFAAALVIGREG